MDAASYTLSIGNQSFDGSGRRARSAGRRSGRGEFDMRVGSVRRVLFKLRYRRPL